MPVPTPCSHLHQRTEGSLSFTCFCPSSWKEFTPGHCMRANLSLKWALTPRISHWVGNLRPRDVPGTLPGSPTPLDCEQGCLHRPNSRAYHKVDTFLHYGVNRHGSTTYLGEKGPAHTTTPTLATLAYLTSLEKVKGEQRGSCCIRWF